jgi:hypothetical protein
MLKNDRVTLVKKDGREFFDIRADVQPRMIFIDDPKLPVEEGDHFTHMPPNGILASYLVLEAHYWGKPGGWQIKVRKETAIPRDPPGHHIYQSGAGSRVNINSQDFSTTVINEANVFEQARKVIEGQVAKESERKEILNRLEAWRRPKARRHTPSATGSSSARLRIT